MTSNAPQACCVSGVKHEGESVGEYKDIGGSKYHQTISTIDLKNRENT